MQGHSGSTSWLGVSTPPLMEFFNQCRGSIDPTTQLSAAHSLLRCELEPISKLPTAVDPI
jgi:hypothetical protein